MYNEALFERVKSLCGACFEGEDGEIEEAAINKWEEKLCVTFPNSYREFLRKFGEGGLCGAPYLDGVSDDEFASVWNETHRYREQGILPQEHIVVATGSDWEEENGHTYKVHYIHCLDTGNMVDGECPVLLYNVWGNGKVEVEEYASNYWEMFDKMVLKLYIEDGIEIEEWRASEGGKRDLPAGMGIRAALWWWKVPARRRYWIYFYRGKRKNIHIKMDLQ